jgi:hypothetical protein
VRLSSREAANLIECSPQRMQRVVGARLDRAGRHAESLGGLRYGGAAEVALEQYLLVLGRQRSGPAILDASRLLAHDGDVARTHRGGGRRALGGQDHDLPALAWRSGTEAWAIDVKLTGLGETGQRWS